MHKKTSQWEETTITKVEILLIKLKFIKCKTKSNEIHETVITLKVYGNVGMKRTLKIYVRKTNCWEKDKQLCLLKYT